MEITKQALIDSGWELTDDPVVPIIKTLLTVENDEDHPDTVELILHKYYNSEQFGLSLPDGSRVELNISSMEDIKTIERLVVGYDPPY